MKAFSIVATIATIIFFSGGAEARDEIRIVGSSTVFPFSAAVSERFSQDTSFRTPIVESTGTGGGFKLFCAGVDLNHPDITNASRKIKSSELEQCSLNGITNILEIKIGFDGIVITNSKESNKMALTLKQLFLALAKEVPVNGILQPNPYVKWSDIDSTLPDIKIDVLGPPPTSGTRDAFVETAMELGALEFQTLVELKSFDVNQFKEIAHTLREDGHYTDAGENDNLIIQKLKTRPETFGIFGFSFLDQNSDLIQGSIINGVEPTFENIADGLYKISRSLYYYVKVPHMDFIPGIEEFIEEFAKGTEEEGYLVDKGLIPLSSGSQEITVLTTD